MGRRQVGTVAALYPVPSQVDGRRGARSGVALLARHRRRPPPGLRQVGDLSTFPWLTARDVPEMVHYQAYLTDPANVRRSSVMVRTPEGELPIECEASRARLEHEYGAPIHLMRTSRGAPDAAGISVVGLGTVRARRADRADAG